ncbi:MAG: STAS domain-containing protein [Halanaerobiaceae bacterium]
MLNNNSKIAVVKPSGRINYSNSNQFKKEMLEKNNNNIKELVVDFSKVESIDSSGLGKLLLMQKRMKEKGGKLKIINVNSEYIRDMFDMIYLNKIIEIEE